MMAAAWNPPTAKAVRINRFFSGGIARSNNLWTRSYTIAPDGRLLILQPPAQTTPNPAGIQVIVNWFEEIQRPTNTR